MKKVLVIDDTKNIRILLSTCLELRGYEVITADNGLEALNIINNTNEAIDLIFLDIRMPGISGTEVLKNIKEARMSCSVVIMTAFATVKNAIECTKLGAVVYLQKPFSPDRINIVLDEIESKSIPNKNESNIDLIIAEARRLLDQNDMDKYNKIHELLKKVIGMDPYNKEVYLMISQFNGLIGNKVEERRFQDIYNLFN